MSIIYFRRYATSPAGSFYSTTQNVDIIDVDITWTWIKRTRRDYRGETRSERKY